MNIKLEIVVMRKHTDRKYTSAVIEERRFDAKDGRRAERCFNMLHKIDTEVINTTIEIRYVVKG